MRRFTIAGMMLLIGLCALGAAALRHANPIWSGSMVGLFAFSLVFACMAAFYRKAERRAFWVGYAVFGAVAISVATLPFVSDVLRPHLPTSAALSALRDRIHVGGDSAQPLLWPPTITATTSGPGGVAFSPSGNLVAALGAGSAVAPGSSPVQIWNTNSAAAGGTFSLTLALVPDLREDFIRVGHTLIAFLIALAGALATRWLFLTNPARRTKPPEDLAASEV